MKALCFQRTGAVVNGKRIRSAIFERRSALSIAAACIVANGIRQSLSAALNAPVHLRLLEPTVPGPHAWQVLIAGAQMFCARGPLADAALVLRPRDALAFATAAFEEPEGPPRSLSPLESHIVARALQRIAPALTPLCGCEIAQLEPILDISGYLTYFEVLVERPAAFRLGIALTRDPVSRPAAGLRIEDLLDVQVCLSVQFAAGEMDGETFLRLRPGVDVPMKTRMGEAALLSAEGIVLAQGDCGAAGARSALRVIAAAKA